MKTIAERKKAAGWITNDVRKKLVMEKVLKPGNTTGEKCMCCTFLQGNSDRCGAWYIPTGQNAYCKSFSPKQSTKAQDEYVIPAFLRKPQS